MKANIIKRTAAGLTAVISAASTIPAMSVTTVFAEGSGQEQGTATITYTPIDAKQATCTEKGFNEGYYLGSDGKYYMKAVSGEGSEEVYVLANAADVEIPATDHSYKAVFNWTKDEADGYKATAEIVCTNEDNKVIAELTSVTVEEISKTEATYAAAGEVTYRATASYNKTVYEETKTITLPQLKHTYTVKWTWAPADKLDWAVARITCNEEPGLYIDPIYADLETVSNPSATCEEAGVDTITATAKYTNKYGDELTFVDTKEVDVPALGHDWEISYKWEPVPDEVDAKTGKIIKKGEGYKCTATRHCKRIGCTHKDDVEEAIGTLIEEVAPTATTKGKEVYTVSFANDIFEAQTYTVELAVVDATYDEPEYTWSDDYKTCTAFARSNNGGKDITEIANVGDPEITATPNCTEAGKKTYSVTFEDNHFTTQTLDVEIPPLGHVYPDTVESTEVITEGEETTKTNYWVISKDKQTATLHLTCVEGDDTQDIEADVEKDEVTTKPDYQTAGKGKRTFVVKFGGDKDNPNTYKLEVEYEIPKLVRNLTINWYWDGVTQDADGNYVFDPNKIYCYAVARGDGYNDGKEAPPELIPDTATCNAPGITGYIAKATFDGVEYTDTKTTPTPKLAHQFGDVTYSWSATATGYKCTATHTCTKCKTKESETVEAVFTEKTPATVNTTGIGQYTATFDNTAFGKKTITVTLAKLVPNFSDPTYEWNADYTECTATRVCTNDPTVEPKVEKSTNITRKKTKSATCTEMGEYTYTATFKDSTTYPATHITVANIPMTEHDWSFPIWDWTPTETGYKASIMFICNTCGEQETTEATVTATEVDGYMIYSATAKVHGETLGSVNKVKIVEKSKTPTITSEAGDNCVKLTWTAVDGAQKYGVAGYQNGAWKLINQGAGTSYVLDNLQSGSSYKVAVIAMFDGEWNMDFSNAVTVTPLESKVPTVSYTPGDGCVKLTWTEVSGAEVYGIAGYNNGEWQLISSGKGTSYTLGNLRAGTNYRVAVVAKIDGKFNMDFSNAIVVTPNAATAKYPKVTDVSFNEKYHQFRVTFDGVANAQAYGIAYYAAGKWRAFAGTIAPDANTWTSPKLSAGKQCKFAVVAKVGGKWNLDKIEGRSVTITVK